MFGCHPKCCQLATKPKSGRLRVVTQPVVTGAPSAQVCSLGHHRARTNPRYRATGRAHGLCGLSGCTYDGAFWLVNSFVQICTKLSGLPPTVLLPGYTLPLPGSLASRVAYRRDLCHTSICPGLSDSITTNG